MSPERAVLLARLRAARDVAEVLRILAHAADGEPNRWLLGLSREVPVRVQGVASADLPGHGTLAVRQMTITPLFPPRAVVVEVTGLLRSGEHVSNSLIGPFPSTDAARQWLHDNLETGTGNVAVVDPPNTQGATDEDHR